MRFKVMLLSVFLLINASVFADDSKILNDTAAFANKTCIMVKQSGLNTHGSIGADIKLLLANFFRRFVDPKANISVDAVAEHYEGVARSDLATAIRDADLCRTKMVELLIPILIGTPAHRRTPMEATTGGIIVAPGATVNGGDCGGVRAKTGGTIFFGNGTINCTPAPLK